MPQLETIIASVLAWAKTRPEIRAAALVGSQARGDARPDSDIDFLFLTAVPAGLRAAWLHDTPWPPARHPIAIRDADYGIAWSRHVSFSDSPEMEFTFAPLEWANPNPLDPGTERVITNGFRILHDPDGLLAALS